MNARQKQQARFWREYSQQLSTAIRYVEALAAAERAVALDQADAESWYVKGTCLAMLARHQEALADFEQALSLDARYAPPGMRRRGCWALWAERRRRLPLSIVRWSSIPSILRRRNASSA